MTNKQKIDVESTEYFIPTGYSGVTDKDREDMSKLSSEGKRPKVETDGYKLLKIGRMYRDEQITSWREGIGLGIITKSELLDGMPESLKDWLWVKIKGVPYDVDGEASDYFRGSAREYAYLMVH